jgi:hypothetical protein
VDEFSSEDINVLPVHSLNLNKLEDGWHTDESSGKGNDFKKGIP